MVSYEAYAICESCKNFGIRFELIILLCLVWLGFVSNNYINEQFPENGET